MFWYLIKGHAIKHWNENLETLLIGVLTFDFVKSFYYCTFFFNRTLILSHKPSKCDIIQ